MKRFLAGFVLVILLVLEWIFDVIAKLTNVIHESVKDVAVAMDKIYNDIKIKREPDS